MTHALEPPGTLRPRSAPTLGRLDRMQPVALVASIAVGLAGAELVPGIAGALGPLVSVGVFVLMTLVMAGVRWSGVIRLVRRPSFLAASIVINFVVNPLVAWALASTMLRGHPELHVGMVLFLVTPCIGWYLVFTELAGGDAELGVGLLAVNIVLQVLLLPLYVSLLAGQQIGVEASTLLRSIGLFLVAPAMLAFVVRRTRAGAALVTGDHVSLVKTAVLMVVVASMFASQGELIRREFSSVARLAVPVVAFFAISFVVAVIVSRSLRLGYEEMVLLVFTTASRNSEASLAIAIGAFASPLVAVAVVVGPAIELPLLMLMVRVLRSMRGQERADFQVS